jgi:hypothetical protein
MSDIVIRVENISKLYRLGEVGTGSLAHDVNRWWHRVRGKEDPYLKIGEVNDRTKSVSSGSKNRKLTTESTTEHRGRCEMEQSQIGPKGEGAGATESKGGAGGNQRADSAEFLEGHSQAGLQMGSEKLASIRSANDTGDSGEQTGSDSESVLIRDIRGKKESIAPDGAGLRKGEFYAVRDVSFELRRGELRTLGRSEKEISEKCLGATKVPDSGRRRHQCLGLIGHNRAGNQAAGQPLGPRQPGGCTGDCRKAARRVRRVGASESTLPQAARRVRRRGKARINMALLKILNGLIKPDAGFHPELTVPSEVSFALHGPGREPEDWEARRTSNRRLALRLQRRREGANQNIYL